MAILWLADVLRAGGLTVVEHAGWQTRAADGSWTPTFGVVHATAAPASQADDTQVRIVRDGREGLPGPIANACVDRLGRWHVLAAGRCNTTLVGTAGPYEGLGNSYALGIEACNDNLGEPWPPVQYHAYAAGWAAICRRLGWAASRLVGHKEHTPGRKSDPTFDMTQFRAVVAARITGGAIMAVEDDTWRLLHDGTRPGPNQTAGGGIPIAWLPRQFYELDNAVAKLAADVADLKARPAVQAAPVDPAGIRAALLDPDVLAAIGAAVVDVTRGRLES